MGTGVESVDREHQELIRMLNDLLQSSRQRRSKEEIRKSIQFLGNYVQTHFANEEREMDRYECPAAGKNADEHAAFLVEYRRMAAQMEQEVPSYAFIMKVQKRMVDWLFGHIRGCDAQLKRSVQERACV